MNEDFHPIPFLDFICFCKSQIVTLTLADSENAAIGFYDGAFTANNNYGKTIPSAAFCIQASAINIGVNANRVLTRFNLSDVPLNATIISAKLDLVDLGPYGSLGAGKSGYHSNPLIQYQIRHMHRGNIMKG